MQSRLNHSPTNLLISPLDLSGFIWDNTTMSPDTLIDEKIKVWAFFEPSDLGHIFPIAMNWRRRLIRFEKVIFETAKKVGEQKFVSIVCQSETANFELEYNANNYLWKVKKVMPL